MRYLNGWHSPLLLVLCCVSAAVFFGCDTSDNRSIPEDSVPPENINRVISMAPNITEIFYALGIDSLLVGVTKFSSYPSEVDEKPSVGGYLDPNYEMVMMLRPDMVFLLPEHEDARRYFDELGISHTMVHNRSVAEILESIITIGETCGAPDTAKSYVERIRGHITAVENAVSDLPRPSVMVVIGRAIGGGAIEDVYIAGRDTYYSDILRIAGGKNVYDDSAADYPMLSAEGIIHLDPDIIIELIPDMETAGGDTSRARADWISLQQSEAVRRGRVHIILGEYTSIPGPRFVLLLDKIVSILHPDVNIFEDYEIRY